MSTQPIIAIDTEGSVRKPWSVQFSAKPGTGCLIKADDKESIKVFNDWIRQSNAKVYLHNSLYDLGVLKSIGIEIPEDNFRDSMILAYNLCIESQGLKALAYRHCSAHQDDYSDIIRDASRDKAIEYLCSVLSHTWPDIEPFIVFEGGKPKLKKPWNIERRVIKIITDVLDNKCDKDGNPTDPRKRWKEIDDYVRDPVEQKLGPMTEATLDDIDPEKAKRYAIRDADITLRIGPILEKKIEEMELQTISAIDHGILPMLDRMQQVGIKLAPASFWDSIENECENQMNRSKWAIYQETGVDLNPASGDQVADLLYNKLGLTPPKLTDSGERGSVNGLCLESLLSENPMVQHIMDHNEASKILGTYVRPLRKLCTVGDGRVRSTIRATRTTTGRLSMADPPLHQIPILSTIGKKLRAGFIVEDGNVFGDWDVDQLEARVCAHDSKDPELCRLFNEGRDVHAETACRMFSVSMSTLSTDPKTGKVNDYRRLVAKHCIAEGQLVLTDRGLVPIEEITLQHKLWDGVEWVTHDGVINQSIREVIEYEGLTATPDHIVYTEKGEKKELRQAALELDRLATAGNGRKEIRFAGDSFASDRARSSRLRKDEDSMREVWPHSLESSSQTKERVKVRALCLLQSIEAPSRRKPFTMGRIDSRWSGGKEDRSTGRHIVEIETNRKQYCDKVQMHSLWQSSVEAEGKSQIGQSGMSILRLHKIRQTVSSTAGRKVYRNRSALQQSEIPQLQGLRRSRDTLLLQIPFRVRKVGRKESSPQGLQGNCYRPDRQRWTLRIGQSETRDLSNLEYQQKKYAVCDVCWQENACRRIRQPLYLNVDMENDQERNDWGADNSKCDGTYQKRSSVKDLAPYPQVARFARVYDILNAGPRKRFTVSNKLISNCFFGLINGITEKGLVNYMITNRCRRPDGSAWTEDDCVQLLKEWFNIYKGVKRFHLNCIEETRQTGLARESIGGRIIYLPQIWSPVKTVRETAERMSYVMFTQGGGQTIIKKAMAVMWKEIFKHRDKFHADSLIQMHDEIGAELPDSEQIKKEVDRLMIGALTQTTKLRVPMKASGGYGKNWLDAH